MQHTRSPAALPDLAPAESSQMQLQRLTSGLSGTRLSHMRMASSSRRVSSAASPHPDTSKQPASLRVHYLRKDRVYKVRM